VAIQHTFTVRMMSLFSEEFFQGALLGLFVVATLCQMAFILTAWRWFPAAQTAKPKQYWGTHEGVSVVICARNEARNLRLFLPEILAQQYAGDWEVLVVDDDSSDETYSVLLEYQALAPRLHVLRVTEKHHPGKKQALSEGIKAARFDCILLTDADCVPTSAHWLQHMVQPLADHSGTEIVLGYGPMQDTSQGGFLENWARFETAFVATQYTTFALAGLPYMGVGRNLAFRKAIFDRVDGFSTHTHIASGDDDLLVNATATRFNTACCLHPDAFVFSSGKKTWRSWLQQKRRHLMAGVAYKPLHQMLLGMLALSHTLHFFLLFVLLGFHIGTKTALFLWLSRSILLLFLFRKSFSTLREPGLLSLFPIYDALLAVYYGAFVPITLIGKKTHSWK